MDAASITKKLEAKKNQEQKQKYQKMFRLVSDNKILGVPMRDVFMLAKDHVELPNQEILKLLKSGYQEVKMAGVSIMDFQARSPKTSVSQRQKLYQMYISNHNLINNWDLVDRAAPYVLGGYLFDKPKQPLYDLAKSKNIWERRSAIVATYFFIRKNQTEDTFKIAQILVNDKEDLIHKAVGGWLREAGKYAPERLLRFLDQNAHIMPRIMLSYATEKLASNLKQQYRQQK